MNRTANIYGKIISLAIALIIGLAVNIGHAAPINPGWRTYQQPDGSSFLGRAFGDEHFSWIETQEGRPVVSNPTSKWFEYATVQVKKNRNHLQSSGLKVQAGQNSRTLSATLPTVNRATLLDMWKKSKDQGPQYGGAKNGISATKAFAAISADTATAAMSPQTRKLLVVLVNFTDDKIRSTDENWSNKFFGASAGSVNDYYKQTTLGKLQFSKATENFGTANDGVIKVNLNYPNPNKGNTDGDAYKTVVKDALSNANAYIAFNSFDTNANGYIDSPELQVILVLAGYEAGYDGITSRGVVGHAWELFANQSVTYDGVYVAMWGYGKYAIIGEWHGDHEATIGVAAHELGHAALNLPDLKDANHAHFTSNWCLMGSGGWAMRPGEQYGTTPALMSAYSRILSGIVTPTVISPNGTAQNITLQSAEKLTYNVVKIPTQIPNEYFLMEVRRDNGYDQGLRGIIGNFTTGSYGMAIWHVPAADANNAVWPYLVAANNMNGGTTPQEPLNRAALYYAGNSTYFGLNSIPNSNTFSGTQTNISVCNIAASGENMTAQVSGASCSTSTSSTSTSTSTTSTSTSTTKSTSTSTSTTTTSSSTTTSLSIPACAAAWAIESTYSISGIKVSYAGKNYQSKWWTKGDNPVGSGMYGPWLDLGACQ